MPTFLEGIDIDPVFIGREQENISASRVLSTILQEGGVWSVAHGLSYPQFIAWRYAA